MSYCCISFTSFTPGTTQLYLCWHGRLHKLIMFCMLSFTRLMYWEGQHGVQGRPVRPLPLYCYCSHLIKLMWACCVGVFWAIRKSFWIECLEKHSVSQRGISVLMKASLFKNIRTISYWNIQGSSFCMISALIFPSAHFKKILTRYTHNIQVLCILLPTITGLLILKRQFGGHFNPHSLVHVLNSSFELAQFWDPVR